MAETYTDFFVLGKIRKGRPLRQLAGVWDRQAAEELAAWYRQEGWKEVCVRTKTRLAENGRCLRSKMMRNAKGKWEVFFNRDDLETISRSIEEEKRIAESN